MTKRVRFPPEPFTTPSFDGSPEADAYFLPQV
jgi:hypothetical protein